MRKTDVLNLYVAKSHLWVEDHLTRAFLDELWSDPDIRVLVAGGKEGVGFLVRGAPPGMIGKSVVGLVDRDFSHENRDQWANSQHPLLRTPGHELENLLLDFPVLAAVSGREAAREIESAARTFAESLKWWMACKAALHEIGAGVGVGFPKEPPLPPDVAAPTTRETAADYIVSSRFWREHDQFVRDRSPSYVVRRVAEIGAEYDRDLASGEWVRSFSGKEIFRHLRTAVPGLYARARGTTSAEYDESVALLIARALRQPAFSTAVSAEALRALRDALRSRARIRA